MINYIYGIDYQRCIRCGIGNPIIAVGGIETDLFISEKGLVARLAELQNNKFVINISPFVASLSREEYKLKFK